MLGLRAGVAAWDERDAEPASVRVEAALKHAPRMLLLGEAGSGKTTLLSWLGVTAARRGFTGDLAAWNGLVPFLLKLRSYTGRDLPGPDGFLDGIAGPLTGHMPHAWVDRQFRAGRALLLVDGVDELVAGERRKVRDWLRRLLHAYPATHVVVTSRPTAAHVAWLNAEEFTTVSLDRMTPTDMRSFIRQWHQAVRARSAELPCAPEELPHYERAFVADLQERPHLEALAANPLLAAMLCGLHLARRRQLPCNRMELYQTALEMLVQRRDAERAIPSAREVRLSLTDKLCVLRDLAWRLSDNNRHELSEDKAVEYVEAKVAAMRHVDVAGRQVFDHLLERSGVLRAPEERRVDFVHRTFQEYLAAGEAAAEDRIGNLIGRAHLDPWRQTVIMAAGHANRSQRIELITGVLDRAGNERRHQRTLRLLAASCLETMESVPQPVAQQLDDCVDSLLPPRRESEAAPLALAGEPVLRRLPPTLKGLSDTEAHAIIRTAALIGGARAMSLLAGYTADTTGVIREALAFCWEYFDPADYARRVLAHMPLEETFLKLVHPSQWAALADLPTLGGLWIHYPFTSGLEPIAALPPLKWLWLTRGIGGNNLAALRHRPELTSLVLLRGTVLDDVSPIADLSELTNLQLEFWESIPQIDIIPVLPKLTSLGLGQLPIDTDLAPLQAFAQMHSISLGSTGRPRGLAVLSSFAELTRLTLNGFDLSQDIPALIAAAPRLRYLALRNCRLPADFSPFNSMTALRTLELDRCTSVDGPVDLATLGHLAERPILNISLSKDQAVRGKGNVGPRVRVRGMHPFK